MKAFWCLRTSGPAWSTKQHRLPEYPTSHHTVQLCLFSDRHLMSCIGQSKVATCVMLHCGSSLVPDSLLQGVLTVFCFAKREVHNNNNNLSSSSIGMEFS
jgi:hypothetical protein